jgi:hypothetical protein
MSDYSAIYLPARQPSRSDSSRSGFETKEAAWEYVYSQMCEACQAERARVLAGEGQPEDWKAGRHGDSLDPPCSFEWIVAPTERVEAATSWDELMEAAGMKLIYQRES